MIELTYTVDSSLPEGEGQINPATRLRIAALERYSAVCLQNGFRIGRGDRFINVVDDTSCGTSEVRISPVDQQALKLERALIREEPLPRSPNEGLANAERIGVAFLGITRNTVGEESGSGPLIAQLQGFAAAGRLRAFTEALEIYLAIVPAARAFIKGQLAGIISNRYLAGYLHLDPQRLGYWLRHNQDFYEKIIDIAHSPLSGSFETAIDAVAVLVELGI